MLASSLWALHEVCVANAFFGASELGPHCLQWSLVDDII